MEQAKGAASMFNLSLLKALVVATRPKQWTKNIIVYFAFFFTINQRWNPLDLNAVGTLFGKVTLAFLLFSLLTGATYIINDIFDIEKHRQHARKRLRPIASGQLPLSLAWITATGLIIFSLAFSFLLEPLFGVVALVYLGTMAFYNLALKRIIILDVLTISAGFLARAVAGAVVIQVPISPWLYICTGLGALFIALGKRRNELVLAGDNSGSQRDTLEQYTPRLLDQLIVVVAPATLVSYILYTFTAKNLPSNNAMMLTIPFVVYGLFRYLYLIQEKNVGESPEEILLTDVPLIIDILLWLATAASVLLVFRA